MLQLTSQQQTVLDNIKVFLESDASIFILRGYAGTGKTTMISQILDYAKLHHDVCLMAPTGRAARVLHEKTHYEATTIHKAIYSLKSIRVKKVEDVADSEFKYIFPINAAKKNSVAIVDEASMVTSHEIKQELFSFGTDILMNDLLTFMRPSFGGKIIFVGDPAQLPPVGEEDSQALNTKYFTDLGLKVMEGELTEVLRQKGDSTILQNAMKIRELLKNEKRNELIFDEKEGEVESLENSHTLLEKYMKTRLQSQRNNCVMICFSNSAASRYNKEIRKRLYNEEELQLKVGDTLMVYQNNYNLNRMNGEMIPVSYVGENSETHNVPVYVQEGGIRRKVIISLEFLNIKTMDGSGETVNCMLLLNFLNSISATLSIDEQKALFIDFCIRHPEVRQGDENFAEALKSDKYYTCLKAKYGYAVTGHKCQGGEWANAFVDYNGRTGLSDDCLRWAYTATTRAQKTLYIANLPHITPFDKFRIDPITKCKKISEECRIFNDVEATPYHSTECPVFLRAKYWCIYKNLQYSPYSIKKVESQQYKEVYFINTPDSTERYEITYNGTGIFHQATPAQKTNHTALILSMINNERAMPITFTHTPSDEIHKKVYELIQSVCDGLNIIITNIAEHEDYSTNYYFYTTGSMSYIKIYFNKNGFITYAKPQSLLGSDDRELSQIIDDINKHLK